MNTSTITSIATAETGVQVLPPPRWVEGNPSLHQITDDIARPLHPVTRLLILQHH